MGAVYVVGFVADASVSSGVFEVLKALFHIYAERSLFLLEQGWHLSDESALFLFFFFLPMALSPLFVFGCPSNMTSARDVACVYFFVGFLHVCSSFRTSHLQDGSMRPARRPPV